MLGHILLGRIPKCFHFILFIILFLFYFFFSVFILKMCSLVDGVLPLQEPHFALSGEGAELFELGALGGLGHVAYFLSASRSPEVQERA